MFDFFFIVKLAIEDCARRMAEILLQAYYKQTNCIILCSIVYMQCYKLSKFNMLKVENKIKP